MGDGHSSIYQQSKAEAFRRDCGELPSEDSRQVSESQIRDMTDETTAPVQAGAWVGWPLCWAQPHSQYSEGGQYLVMSLVMAMISSAKHPDGEMPSRQPGKGSNSERGSGDRVALVSPSSLGYIRCQACRWFTSSLPPVLGKLPVNSLAWA